MLPTRPFRLGKQTGFKEKNKGSKQTCSNRDDDDFLVYDPQSNNQQKPTSHLKGQDNELRIKGIDHIETQCQQIEHEISIPVENIEICALPNSKLDTKDDNNHKDLNNLSIKDDTDENTEFIMDRYKKLEDSNSKKIFLDNITGTLEGNLVASIQNNNKLQDDETKNSFLSNELEAKFENSKYRSMFEIRSKLPSYKKKYEILELIRNNQVVLITGETGCGKTTQMAQFILDDAIMFSRGSTCRIVCTQPRRISAISVAKRVADERAESIGEGSVGYQIKLEKKMGREFGSILFCTTGILLQHIQRDSALSYYSHIIIDEIQERNTISDFTLAILKSIISVRPDIKVILMGTTLNASAFSEYFNNCPTLNIPCLTYPVEELYLEDIFVLNGFKYFPKKALQKPAKIINDSSFLKFVLPYVKEIRRHKKYPEPILNWLKNPISEYTDYELILELIHYICKHKDDGAILVFVSGIGQILKLTKMLKEKGFGDKSRYFLFSLHSTLTTISQKLIFKSPPHGVRKIILSTNIAETSVTIDDVGYVINNGRMKLGKFDAENELKTGEEEWVSLANSRQRRGRAGHVKPGVCYHLYTRGREKSFDDCVLPEMMRTSLEEVILQAKILQVGMVKPFLAKVMNPPESRALEVALKLLIDLNALDKKENLTPLGFHLAKLPIGPLEGKMIVLGAMFSCLRPIMTIAASLNCNDPFIIPANKKIQYRKFQKKIDENLQSDHILITRVMNKFIQANQSNRAREYCCENFLMLSTMNMLHYLKSQYAEYLCDLGFIKTSDYTAPECNKNSNNAKLLKFVLTVCLCPNIAICKSEVKNRNICTEIVTAKGAKVEIHPYSVNSVDSYYESPLILYHTKLKTSSNLLRSTTMVNSFPVVLSAKTLKITGEESDIVTFSLNSQINFTCVARIANLIKQIRNILEWLIDYLIFHPEEISCSSSGISGKALKFVVDLVSAEKHPGILDYSN